MLIIIIIANIYWVLYYYKPNIMCYVHLLKDFMTTPWERNFYYPHFTHEETEAGRLCNSPGHRL